MKKNVKGLFTQLEGKPVYKIENYDAMENFFMTITSSSDIWNFCWSQGGVTAGRIDSNHAVFPYYTADKVSDAGSYTGNYTAIAVKKGDDVLVWEPFTSFYASASVKKQAALHLKNNIYKNFNGTEVWFEEINEDLNLLFRTGWTSSEKYGLVRTSYIENLNDSPVEVSVLDGCQNILPAGTASDFQNGNSVLLDAYKKTDLDEKGNIALFGFSSVVSDRAEPSESLLANTCWFSTNDKIILATDAPVQFTNFEKLPETKDFITSNVTKGKRSSAFICKKETLSKGPGIKWYQVFDTTLTLAQVEELKALIKDRAAATEDLEKDIQKGNDLMTEFLSSADGIQETADTMACLHHQENVMFNIMRGGIFANNGKISVKDFLKFVTQRNTSIYNTAVEYTNEFKTELVDYGTFADLVKSKNNAQFTRLFLEYMPITFSRRHGDPSRPWNIFSIRLKDREGNPILNYEGNWRDIFQNWEAIAYSFPVYIKNMCAKFLNAMTADGFNPYKVNRQGIDWEIPEPNNPWAAIGYWGDHQVIYFAKLLEFFNKTNRNELLASLDEKIYTSANVPYRIKNYEDILKNPRDTIVFDRELSNILQKNAKTLGGDAKLILATDNEPYLVSFAAKALQIVISKVANLIPGGGIWLNTQRPEWNDANNALAGYGLSVVTLCYLYRYLNLLTDIFSNTKLETVTLPKALKECFVNLSKVYAEADAEKTAKDAGLRKAFTDKTGKIFEAERTEFYKNGYNGGEETISTKDILAALNSFLKQVEVSIKLNKRADGLYHSYNTVKISSDKMEVEYLQEMLEGQVAILSSDLLTPAEAQGLVKALQSSKIYESRQNSFMLYPNKELPAFQDKNCVSGKDADLLEKLYERTGLLYVEKDINGVFHFNPEFRNANIMKAFIENQSAEMQPTDKEKADMLAIYEKTFNHQSFTGRSGTFYAYEGLGSIYWHMVSKLLLAVQENIFKAYKNNDAKTAIELTHSYYEVRSGLGYNKSPELYGAFPADPYSHTPSGQGAKQPGMTGQVKEEVLTRFGELGVSVEDGIASFNPIILKKSEIKEDGSLSFTWCGIPVTYKFTNGCENHISVNGNKRNGTTLTQKETADLFLRQNIISSIEVEFSSGFGF